MAESPCGWYLPITWPVIWIAIDGAEIALAIDQGVAHGEGLGHADQGIVDGGIAVRMVLAHHLAGDLDRHRWSRNCPGHRPGGSAWRRAGPCGPGNRRWRNRRADGTCPSPGR